MSRRHILIADSIGSLFIRLEELVLANSGEDEFEEIFKLIVAKLWDETCKKPPRFVPVKDAEAASLQIESLFLEAKRAWPGVFSPNEHIKLTPEHLTACVETLSKFNLLDTGLEALHASFEFLSSATSKGTKGQFFTPRHVVEFCVRMINPSITETVLDPACGSGAFLLHSFQHFVKSGQLKTRDQVQAYLHNNVWGFDFDVRASKIAKALTIIAGGEGSNIIRLNSLLKPQCLMSLFSTRKPSAEAADDILDPNLTIEDVLRNRIRRAKAFDIILTNPPFAGEIHDRNLLDSYTLAKRNGRVERDILFLERCLELLKPGGRIAIVLPHNKLASSAYEYVREWLLNRARVVAVIGLGRNTFLPHTHQKTAIVFAQRRKEKKKLLHPERIFFGISEVEGKNSKGEFILKNGLRFQGGDIWEILDHDLDALHSAFLRFCKEEHLAWGDG